MSIDVPTLLLWQIFPMIIFSREKVSEIIVDFSFVFSFGSVYVTHNNNIIKFIEALI